MLIWVLHLNCLGERRLVSFFFILILSKIKWVDMTKKNILSVLAEMESPELTILYTVGFEQD